MAPANVGFEDAPPDPGATIESLGALGYSPESAIADLIDNSISAGARRVKLFMYWNGEDSWCAVVDDGSGMSEPTLRRAMRIGSSDPLDVRAANDLGRFGLGLKTASFAQARELTVATRDREGRRSHVRCWDLDHVRAAGKWQLQTSAPAPAEDILREIFPTGIGTAVVWRRLRPALIPDDALATDIEAETHFLARVATAERHLAMTFGRLLLRPERPLAIQINGRPIAGWDPFLLDHPATQQRPDERLTLRSQSVRVLPYVLPHRSKLSENEYEAAGGPAGWNEQQGFYVYRSDRLIQAGGWLTLRLSRDDTHNLARIAIDVPPSLDHDWSLDVKKASVRPPSPLAGDLRKIADDTRRAAAAVYKHRGTHVGRSADERKIEVVWKQLRRHGQVVFRLNRAHPLVEDLLERAGPMRSNVSEILRLIEATVPTAVLPAGRSPEGDDTFDDLDDDDKLERLASRTYDNLLNKGFTRAEAAQRLGRIEPFNRFPDVVKRVTGADG